MFLLFVVSFIWAFSFGLIKGKLAGVDPTVVATLRLALALVVFLPFWKPRAVSARVQFRLAAIGAIQFGLMYVVYLRAFAHLQAFEVALFTITTPLFVALLDGAARKRFVPAHAIAALLSVVGGGIVLWQRAASSGALVGVLLVQASNLCFAAGQLAWKRARERIPAEVGDGAVFAPLYAGALVVSAGWSLFTSDWTVLHLTWTQATTLLYLGVLASGLCFFWWNHGATQVNTGTLAAFNNAKIPLAVACSLLFFREHTDLIRLLAGGVVLAAGVWVAQQSRRAA